MTSFYQLPYKEDLWRSNMSHYKQNGSISIINRLFNLLSTLLDCIGNRKSSVYRYRESILVSTTCDGQPVESYFRMLSSHILILLLFFVVKSIISICCSHSWDSSFVLFMRGSGSRSQFSTRPLYLDIGAK